MRALGKAVLRILPGLLLVWISPRAAEANHALALFRGERHGPLAPQRSTSIRVEREDLHFDLADDLRTARVIATYRMNAATPESADVAFAFVRTANALADDADADASVEIDGVRVAGAITTDGQILEPRVRARLAADPALSQALGAAAAKGARSEEAERILRGVGGPCAAGCEALLRWFDMTETAPRRLRHEAALDAAREIIPGDVEELQRGWSTLAEERRLGFLLFRVDIAAGQARAVTVRYRHRATVDRRDHAPGLFTFDYLLSPAKRWAAFGPLDITVRVPDDVAFSSPLPFRREAGAYHASFASLPDGELRFWVMPTRGLWLGLSQHSAYWAILAAVVGLATLVTGVVAGTLGSAWRAWIRLSIAGALATLVAYAVLAPLRAALPEDALGFDDGYDHPPNGDIFVPLGGIAGCVAGVAASAVRRRRGRTM